MNWGIGANCYLLKAVHTYGKDWDLVSEVLQNTSKTFLKDETLQDLSKQSCSLQYNYIIASTRQRYPADLNEEQLLNNALDHYTTLRREQLHETRLDILRAIKIEEEDAEKLRQARYSEIPLSRLTVYRKRCRAFGIADKIGKCMNLEPLSPSSEEQNKIIRDALLPSELSNSSIGNEVIDGDGGSWFSVKVPRICDLFTCNTEQNYRTSVANFLRAQAFAFQRLGIEVPDEDTSSLDSTSSVQTHPEVTNPLSLTDVKDSTQDSSKLVQSPININSDIKGTSSPPKCLEIQAEPFTPASSALVSDSETLASPVVNNQSMNSSPTLSNVEMQSPTVKNVRRNRKHARTKRKPPTVLLNSSNPEIDFAPALSPLVSSSINLEELVGTGQSSLIMARRWRRALLSALSTVYSHRHAYVFMNPVTEDIAPGYSTVVYEPVDLTSLRRRMEASLSCLSTTQVTIQAIPASPTQVVIDAATRFIRDFLLMFVNARMYNNQNHEVHRMAGEMYYDVVTELQSLWSVMAEDIPGFPALPVINSYSVTNRPPIRPVSSSAATTTATSPSQCQSAVKDGDIASLKTTPGSVRQNKRLTVDTPTIVNSPPRKRYQSSSSSSGETLNVGVTTRSK